MSEYIEEVEVTGGINLDEQEDSGIAIIGDKPKRRPFCVWKVGNKEYKLKLTTAMICKLEDKYKKNLLNCISEMPALSMMLTIVQAAMQKYHHGISYSKVQEIFDEYTDEGGNQTDFFTDVIIEVLTVSGFFTENQTEDVSAKMDALI